MTETNESGRLNLEWAMTLVAGLAGAGVRDVVISPGSRSTPLTLACLRQPGLRCTVILDERSAAWFALGRVRADGRPVALVCTSGTAAANWLPAVVEAKHSRLPLLLLSADRPPELQHCGANQTIDQGGLFGDQVRAAHAPGAPFAGFAHGWLRQLAAQAVSEACWPLAGPVHLNLAFREPLLPADPDSVTLPAGPRPHISFPQSAPDAAAVAALAERLAGRRGVIVVGGGVAVPGFADAVAALAARLDCPLLADPHSGLRFGPHDKDRLCCHHERWLRDEARRQAMPPDWVLRFGEMPVTRTLQSYLAGCGEHHVVEAHGRWPDPLQQTRQLLRGDERLVATALAEAVVAPAPDGWMPLFRAAENACADHGAPPPEGALLAALCRSLPDGSHLFCGNSLPIRDLAAWSGQGDNALRIHANRGASGIDGNIATAAGLADSAPTVAVIGDLTAQHDLGSLVLLRERPLVVIVIDNGGGGIFDYLPPAALPEYEAGWLTPQGLDFGHAAAAFGLRHFACADPREAAAMAVDALAAGTGLLAVLTVDRAESKRQRSR